MSDTIIATTTPVCLRGKSLPPKLPRKERTEPAVYNPVRRLASAVVLQAIQDVAFTTKTTTPDDQRSAAEFLDSETGRFMLAELLGKAA